MKPLHWLCVTLAALQLTSISSEVSADDPGVPPLLYEITDDADDGTEIDRQEWRPQGYDKTARNRVGRAGDERFDIGLRFNVPDLIQGETFAYARLALPGTGAGQVDTKAEVLIVGIDQDGVGEFATIRPSQLPRTEAQVAWTLAADWPDIDLDISRHAPLPRYSPNIAPIINEIVGRPDWGTGQDGKTLGIIIRDDNSPDCNFVAIEDHGGSPAIGVMAPGLELYRTAEATLVAQELLGRPTDHSVTLNAMSLLTLDAYVEYGTAPGVLPYSTPVTRFPGGTPFEIVIDGLEPGSTYYYRLRYRRVGGTHFVGGAQRHFRTQQPVDKQFMFTITSDSHIWEAMRERQGTNLELYRRTLMNVAEDDPEFHVDLGDTFLGEDYSGGDALDFDDALYRHMAHRPFFDILCHSAPLFLVMGNHEGEQGWRIDGTPDNLAVWAANARKLLYPNPAPDDFYSGCEETSAYVGWPENYYSFQWGDALFVMLDPYRYTTSKPHGAGGSPGSGDNWDWTYGFAQYDWLRRTLARSTATFKFVFSHQVVGGADLYGRGGVEAARHALGGAGSYEWGGEDSSGRYAFDRHREGWGTPIHDLLVENGVTIYFRGHDHVFVKQELDGVVYQECPQPSDSMYAHGLFTYRYGDLMNNSGHLRVTVRPSDVLVEYVRAYLPGDGENGTVGYAYIVQAQP